MKDEFEPKGYVKEKLTIDIVQANIYGIIAFIPVIIIFALPYYLIWGGFVGSIYEYSMLIPAFVIGIILHELIHVITWARFADMGFQSIKFGIFVIYLTPYCYCKEPLRVDRSE